MSTGAFLVFDIKGDWGHFKQPHTTMSMKTFGVPTGTAVIGIISAILGLDKSSYWCSFPAGSYDLAIGLRAPVKCSTIPFKTLKTESSKHFYNIDSHKLSNMEFIKDCCFRIWFRSTNTELMTSLESLLSTHQSVYSLSLGLAWCLADYEYVGRIELLDNQYLSTDSDLTEIHSIIPHQEIQALSFDGRHISKCTLPIAMQDNSRVLAKIEPCIFDLNAQPLHASVHHLVSLKNGDNIVLL